MRKRSIIICAVTHTQFCIPVQVCFYFIWPTHPPAGPGPLAHPPTHGSVSISSRRRCGTSAQCGCFSPAWVELFMGT